MPIQLPDARQLSDEALQALRLRALRGIELGYSELDLAELLGMDAADWREELPSMHEHFAKFGDQLPAPLREQLNTLQERLGAD